MIILLLILAIFATVVGFVICIKNDFESAGIGIFGILTGSCGCLVIIVMVVIMLDFADSVISDRYIDEKITMYQEENAKIEEQIDTLIQNYMKYESDTFSEFKSEDSMTLVSLYPELKSDELVQKQMSVYSENSKKIKELKEQKIDVAKSKWWLYFGK